MLPSEVFAIARISVGPLGATWRGKDRCAHLCPQVVARYSDHQCCCIVTRQHHRKLNACPLCARPKYGDTQRGMYRELLQILHAHPRKWWLLSQVPVPKPSGQVPDGLRWGKRARSKHRKQSPWYADVVLFFQHCQQHIPVFVELDGASHLSRDFSVMQRLDADRQAKLSAAMECFDLHAYQFIVWTAGATADFVAGLDGIVDRIAGNVPDHACTAV